MVHIRFREHGLTLEEKRIKRNAAAKRRRDAARTAAGKVRRGTGATCQWGARKANGKCPRWTLKRNGTQQEKQMALDSARFKRQIKKRGPTRAPR